MSKRGCLACGNDHDGPGLQCERCRSGGSVTKPGAKKSHQPVLPPKSEAEIRIEIRAWLELQGAKVWDMEQNRQTRQTPGVSDLIACWPGRGVFFIEVKTPTNDQSDAQRDFEDWVTRSHGFYFVARSIEDCEAKLATFPIHVTFGHHADAVRL